MQMIKIEDWVDINAPHEEVFDIVANCDRRLQLSPSFGKIKVEDISKDFPREGSCYRVELMEGDEPGYEATVTDFQPDKQFAYQLTDDHQTRVTWKVENLTTGTRLTCSEEFVVGESDQDDLVESESQVVKEWLANIKNYAELRGDRIRLFVKWVMDRFLLKLPVEQRRIIITILAFEAVMMVTFVMAVIGFGIAKLLMR